MNETAKVGAFTVGGLMALGAATMSLSNFDFGADNNYILYAGFDIYGCYRSVMAEDLQPRLRLAQQVLRFCSSGQP